MLTFFTALIAGAVGGGAPQTVTLIHVPSGIAHVAISPANAASQVAIVSTGVVNKIRGTVTTNMGAWLLGGAAADYEVRFTKTSGDAADVGTVGSWMACSTTRTIGYATTTDGPSAKSGVFLIELRSVATSAVLAAVSTTLDCTVEV